MVDQQSEKLRAFLKDKKEKREKEEMRASVKVPKSMVLEEKSKEMESLDSQKMPKLNFDEELSFDPSTHHMNLKSLVGSERLMDEERMIKLREDADAEREAQLKAYLERRKEIINEQVEDDPYGGDYIARKNLRYLQKYLDRPDIENIKEIIINRPEEVGLEHADGTWEWVADPDMTQSQLEDIARSLANQSGQLFHSGNPILSVKMPGGHRVQIVSGFNAPSGFVFSMRLQRKEKFGLNDFTMPDEQRETIKQLVKNKKTLLISGGTGTGKTSFMNALIPSIPEDERLVTLEDVPELRIPHRNWAPLLFSGSTTAQGDQGVVSLLNACLRLRPDRIILGEIRKENGFAFCSAINTGHEGSMATIHANNPKMAIDAVINRVLMNGDMPESALNVLRRQLISDIYAVVQLNRIHRGVKAELTILDGDESVLG